MRRFILLFLAVNVICSADVHAGWEYISPMPHGRFFHDATVGKDGRIYVLGGVVFRLEGGRMTKKYNDGRYSTLVYDPRVDKWKYLEAVPGYIMPSRFMYFDQDKDKWKYKMKESIHNREKNESTYVIPEEYLKDSIKIRHTTFYRQGDGVRVVTMPDGRILWIGGKDFASCALDTVLSYDPAGKEWNRVSYEEIRTGPGYEYKPTYHIDIPPMHEQRSHHEAVMTSDGKIYVIGGGTVQYIPALKDLYSNTMECYDPETKRWEYKAPFKTSIVRFAAIVGPDDKIYVFGGGTYNESTDIFSVFNTVEVYDPEKDEWSSRRPMPSPKEGHAGVLGADGKMYIMGGTKVEYGPPLKEVMIYDPKKDTWKKGPSMNCARAGLAAVSTPDGKIYAIGGTDVGAHQVKESVNFLLPREIEFSEGKVQDTVEVLDISK